MKCFQSSTCPIPKQSHLNYAFSQRFVLALHDVSYLNFLIFVFASKLMLTPANLNSAVLLCSLAVELCVSARLLQLPFIV